ncbi:MAG: hypothetical protein RLY83_773 [Actinomycetota bacterium]|jgi:hypothetical protein
MKFVAAVSLFSPKTELVDPLTDPNKVYYSPGIIGFVAVFLMMLAATFLILDMVRRVRRVRYRTEIQEKLARETSAKGSQTNK